MRKLSTFGTSYLCVAVLNLRDDLYRRKYVNICICVCLDSLALTLHISSGGLHNALQVCLLNLKPCKAMCSYSNCVFPIDFLQSNYSLPSSASNQNPTNCVYWGFSHLQSIWIILVTISPRWLPTFLLVLSFLRLRNCWWLLTLHWSCKHP